MVFEYTDYRSYLKSELASRCQKNPRYSLRSFASQLQVSPGQLSRVINGSKNISQEKAIEVSAALNLKGKSQEYFCQLVHLESAKTHQSKVFVQKKLNDLRPTRDFHTVELDTFKVISEWYHYALLEMTELRDFKSNPQWISRRLGVSRPQVELAIERLKRLHLLKEEKGTLKKTRETYLAVSDIPNDALQNFHRQTLDHAKESLTTQHPSERHISSVTMAIDPSKLKEAHELTRQYRVEMEKLLSSDRKEEVYQFAVQLFRLTKKRSKK